MILGAYGTSGATVLETCDLHTRFVVSSAKYGAEKYALAASYTYTNGPATNVQGFLTVQYARNRLTLTIVTDSGEIYFQNCSSSTWGSWKRIEGTLLT